ncbi:hypothetical protein RRG08_016086 [Elysia crispata]|uniref:Kinesin-like protein KIF26A/B helical domain-containing protein n=1 Tax=Elysia crispata TaxID=231223 RepID=A0AAE0ZNV2_9GAST|nr:hypothetical protein RRG08_016086 [Elysia crispata]
MVDETQGLQNTMRDETQSIRVDNIAERLVPPEPYDRWYSRPGQLCAVCGTGLARLRHEAAAMVQSIQLAHTSSTATGSPTVHYRARMCSHSNRHFILGINLQSVSPA